MIADRVGFTVDVFCSSLQEIFSCPKGEVIDFCANNIEVDILIFFFLVPIAVLKNCFNLGTLNTYGLKSNLPYVLDLLDSQDILFINEHWLQEKDIITIVDICAGKNIFLPISSPVLIQCHPCLGGHTEELDSCVRKLKV